MKDFNFSENFETFHLVFYGLDDEKLSDQELIEQIYNELRVKFDNIHKDGIFLVSQEALFSFVVKRFRHARNAKFQKLCAIYSIRKGCCN